MGPHSVCRFFVAGIFALEVAAAAEPVEQSISASRQFIVYGTDVAGRGAICDFAERTKRELLTLLGQRDNWTAAIVINAQYPRANLPEAPRLSVDLAQTGFGLKLQLDLVIDSGVSRPEIRREFLRALVLEMIYRAQPNIPAGAAYFSPPDWFLEGVPAQQSDLPRDRVTAILTVPVAAKNVLPLEKFLAQRPELLDAPGRNIYRAYSFALVDLLSHAPDGSHRLAQFLLDLPASSNDPMAELRSHFPGLFESDSAEKTWEKQVARLATDQPYHLMSSAETERRLDETLRLKIADGNGEKTYELMQFPIFLKEKSAKTRLESLAHELRVLATRAHPVYAPIITDYSEISRLLLRGRTLDVPRRLERLQNSRKAIAAQMRGIDDYLNWYEATSLAGPSGEFADYLKAAKRAAQPERTKRDPISVYLDVLETQFEQ
ncbi:MAG: hypothetical protein DME97_08925 [Verrucomicrobia bacterium]|nr:MAG: hypothetical protein DME97_08925 [Verrucomicrobiota bacterium]